MGPGAAEALPYCRVRRGLLPGHSPAGTRCVCAAAGTGCPFYFFVALLLKNILIIIKSLVANMN